MSGDGSNGRSRYEIQTTNGSGPRMRPWPIGRHHKPAIIDYHTAALDDMVAAVKLSAEKIRSPELITQIARNPRGVWNPPVLVLARAYIRQERFFWLDASLLGNPSSFRVGFVTAAVTTKLGTVVDQKQLLDLLQPFYNVWP